VDAGRAYEVFLLLLGKQLINRDIVEKILLWQHTGFNVHSKVRAESKEEAEWIGKYMIRPVLSLRRLSLDEAKGQVVYQYGKRSSAWQLRKDQNIYEN